MKNPIIISALLFTIITSSCKNSNSSELKEINEQLEILRNENALLKDSISKLKNDDLGDRQLIGIPEGKLQVGKKNRIIFLLHSNKTLPKYEIYTYDGNKENKIGDGNLSKFDYEFIPKSLEDNKIKLKVTFPDKSRPVTMKNETTIPVN
ncbi:hypothetical protein [Flavobacterium petrolei]|uniref:hypothetical protein n=1 Tax=Flavobacterium petrolei TaxID=2259594 RepID=UPI003757DD98